MSRNTTQNNSEILKTGIGGFLRSLLLQNAPPARPVGMISKSLAEFAARRRRNNLIIFPAACTSEKYFSAASVSKGRAQPAASHIGRKIARFFANYKEEDDL